MRAHRTAILAVSAALLIAACTWDPAHPFDHDSPAVNEAISALDAGDATQAALTLEEYLSTGQCADGNIGAPGSVHRLPNGAFDLGLSLFKIGEAFGKRFGDEQADAAADGLTLQRTAQIDCALRVVRAVAEDENAPLDLRARARYLEGNLQFLGQHYEDAVKAYDLALKITPGQRDAGDVVGRDAAWNRAIALRRIEEQKDAGKPDSGDDASGDGGGDGGGGDSGNDSGGDSGKGDGGGDSGKGDASDKDSSSPPPPKEDQPDAGPPPPSKANQDERILDQLANAPTVQQEAARKGASQRRVRGMADK
ncbi:MAG: hypothetical protein ABIP89_04645 [Polyangiaceae bacterium]